MNVTALVPDIQSEHGDEEAFSARVHGAWRDQFLCSEHAFVWRRRQQPDQAQLSRRHCATCPAGLR